MAVDEADEAEGGADESENGRGAADGPAGGGPAAGSDTDDASGAPVPEDRPIRPDGGPGSGGPPGTGWGGTGGTVLVVAATVVVVALMLDVTRLDARIGQLSAQVTQRPLQRAAAAALADPRAQRATLLAPAQASTPGVEGMLVVEPAGIGYLDHVHLPAAGAGRTYQLWLQTSGPVVSVAVLGARPELTAFRIDTRVAATALFVSVEPAGGSVQPTGPVVGSASISSP